MRKLKEEKGVTSTTILIIILIILLMAVAAVVLIGFKNGKFVISKGTSNNNVNEKISKNDEYLKLINKDEENNCFVYIDKNGNLKKLPCDGFELEGGPNSYVQSTDSKNDIVNNSIVVKKDNEYALIDSDGNKIVDFGTYHKMERVGLSYDDPISYYEVCGYNESMGEYKYGVINEKRRYSNSNTVFNFFIIYYSRWRAIFCYERRK